MNIKFLIIEFKLKVKKRFLYLQFSKKNKINNISTGYYPGNFRQNNSWGRNSQQKF